MYSTIDNWPFRQDLDVIQAPVRYTLLHPAGSSIQLYDDQM